MYSGIKEIELNDEDLAAYYEGRMKFDLVTNQYLLVKDSTGKVVEKKRWDGSSLMPLKFKKINNVHFGEVKPLNIEQECLMDLLNNEGVTVKVVSGAWGGGKSFLTLCWAIDAMEKNKSSYKKIVYVRNNVDVKDTTSLGALPSSANEKLKPWAMPIADILGSEIELDRFINDGKIELAYLGFIRGRSFDDSIIIVNECQNHTAEHIALLISRVGKNSVIIFDGDTRQVDRTVFEKNSGVTTLVEKLAGNELFGMVQLKKTERSRTAALADLITGSQ